MRPLAPDPGPNAALDCRWSSTGHDGARSNAADQRAIPSRLLWLDHASDRWHPARRPLGGAGRSAGRHRRAIATLRAVVKSP